MDKDNKQIIILVSVVIVLILILVGLVLFFGIRNKKRVFVDDNSNSTSILTTNTTEIIDDKIKYSLYYDNLNMYLSNDTINGYNINKFELYDCSCSDISYNEYNKYFNVTIEYNSNGFRLNENDSFVDGTMISNVIIEISLDSVLNIYSLC